MAASSRPGSRFASQTRVPLPGSERKPFSASSPVSMKAERSAAAPRAGSAQTGNPESGNPESDNPKPGNPSGAGAASTKVEGRITVSVIVRPKAPMNVKTLGRPGTRMTRAEFTRQHGADPVSVKAVKAFAQEFGLTVEQTQPGRRTLMLSGTAAAMEKAFGVSLSPVEMEGRTLRVREGSIHLPEELAGHVEAVLGLDNRPQAVPHFRIAKAAATNVSYTPVQVAALYGFPSGAKATGQTIGIIELGGGYRAADLTAYFKTLGQTAPTVTAVSVDKGKNTPSTADGADGEVMLDIEVSAAVAPGAKVAVYFTPNTDQGFIDAITTAVHDTKNKPSVISISWGGPESTWTAQAMTSLDSACQAAAMLGVTITVAAGDDGSTDGVSGTANHVDFPASSPHVLGCGGTKLSGSGSTIASEVVWNELSANEGATGGGVSATFPLPTWQANAKVPAPTVKAGGRGVPDVAGNADPATGYSVRVDGGTYVIGGTSAVAPLWAGLIALANAQNKTAAGFINPTLYAASAKSAFRDITSGNNGGFKAGSGWDACTGLGSPMGAQVIKLLAPKATTGTGTKGSGTKNAGTKASGRRRSGTRAQA